MPQITDIKQSLLVPQLIKDEFAREGTFELLPDGTPQFYSGGFTAVFPFIRRGEKWAFRCWHSEIGNVKRRMEMLSDALKKSQLPYFCEFTYVDEGLVVDGKVYPTTRMRWVDGQNLCEYIAEHNSKAALLKLADAFLKMCQDLHRLGIAHGDLHHENIIVNEKGQLFLIDYDSMYVPQMKGESDIIAGKKEFQHPNRKNNALGSERLDYFSELIIYTSILAIAYDSSLIVDYAIGKNSDTMLFLPQDYADLKHSAIYQRLFSLGDTFHLLLHAMEEYLSHSDINELRPFDTLLDGWTKTPVIKRFTVANRGFVYRSEKASLKWEVENAECILIDGKEVGTLVTSKESSINKDHVFTLCVRNGLREVSATAKATFVEQPEISFSASTATLRKGKHEETLLKWSVKHAKTVKLQTPEETKDVPLKGSVFIAPKQTACYTLRVTGLDGKRVFEKMLSIDLVPEAEVVFEADKLFVLPSVPVTLRWNVKNAGSVSLLGAGDVPMIGQTVVEPTKETIYTLVVKDVFGTHKKQLTVRMLPMPIIKTLMVPTPSIKQTINVNVQTTALTATLQLENPPKMNLYVNMHITPPSVELGRLHSLHLPPARKAWWGRLTTRIGNIFNKLRKQTLENNE